MKIYWFTVTFSNGHTMRYSCNAESYAKAYLWAVEANVSELNDIVVPDLIKNKQ